MNDNITNDSSKSSPWDKLLDDLGAQPDESAFERHQPSPQEIPPTVEWSEAPEAESKAESAAETKASTNDWNSLAESLGLEVEEPAQIEPVKEQPVKEQNVAPEAKLEPAESEPAQNVEETLAGFAPPNQAAFLEEIDDDLDPSDDPSDAQDELPPLPSQMDQALSETAWEEISEEESDNGEADATDKIDDEGDDEGDGISGEAARSAFDALFSDGASSWGSAFLQKPKRDDSSPPSKGPFADDTGADSGFDIDGTDDGGGTDAMLSDSLDAKTGAASDESDEEESERPKRKRSRRRRRGGKGRKPAGERVAEGEASEESSSEGRDGLSEKDSSEPTEKPKRRRSGHRSRPTVTVRGLLRSREARRTSTTKIWKAKIWKAKNLLTTTTPAVLVVADNGIAICLPGRKRLA